MTSNTTWRRYLIPTALAWLACLALWWSRPFERGLDTPRPSAGDALRCAPAPGARAAYRVRVDMQSLFDPARALGALGSTTTRGKQQRAAISLDAELYAQALERGRSGVTLQLALHIHDPSVAAGEQPALEGLERPFLAVLGADCQLREFGFAADSAPEVVNRLQGLMQGLSMSLSGRLGQRQGTTWSSQEWDSLGMYVAEYQRADAPRTFTKRRRAYLKARPDSEGDAAAVHVRVLSSRARASLDADFGWLEHLESKEQLRLSASDQFTTDLTCTTRLDKIELAAGDTKFLLRPSVEAVIWRKDASPVLASRGREATPPKQLRQMSLELALAGFAELLRAGEDEAAVDGYALYLRSQPSAAQELVTLIARRQVPADLEAALFRALEIADTPEAHAALLGGLGDDHIPMNRVRAASALSDLAHPDVRTLDGLRQAARHAQARDPDAATRVRNAATLALGVLEERMRDKNPELAELSRQAIRESLAQSKSDEQRGVVLGAIGNSGDVRFVPDLQPFFGARDAALRSNAIEALRKMPMEETQGLFAALMAREPAASVRSAIVRTFAEQARPRRGVATAVVLDSAIAQLRIEKDRGVRASLIELIGPACASSETAMQALAEQFARETEAPMLTLIGRYVPAGRLGA